MKWSFARLNSSSIAFPTIVNDLSVNKNNSKSGLLLLRTIQSSKLATQTQDTNSCNFAEYPTNAQILEIS